MEKLNKFGSEMLEYKKELQKDYPELIIKSLNQTIDHLAENGVIDVDTHFAIKENSIDEQGLRELLLQKQNFLKTKEELFVEYEGIRLKLNEYLEITDENNSEIKSISSVDEEQLCITKEFILTEQFLKDYFDIESENDFNVLMSRKGFIEKFAILRLNKVLKDFIKQQETSDSFTYMNSNVFFEAERNVYGIYLLFKIPIDNTVANDKLEEIAKHIKYIIEESEVFFKKKMSI